MEMVLNLDIHMCVQNIYMDRFGNIYLAKGTVLPAIHCVEMFIFPLQLFGETVSSVCVRVRTCMHVKHIIGTRLTNE